MTFSANVDTRRLRLAMRRAPGRLAAEMRKSFDQHGFIFEGHVRSTLFGGDPGLTGHTGKLARSVGHTRPEGGKLGDLRMRVFVGGGVAPYARIQEFGGVVRPKRSKYLTVPLPDNLTAGGVARYKSARDLFGSRPKDTFIARSRAGNLVIGLREGDDVKWLWLLRKSVRLKPRFGFRKAFRSSAMQRDRTTRFDAAVRRALQGGR